MKSDPYPDALMMHPRVEQVMDVMYARYVGLVHKYPAQGG
jgi:hypothetical protein